jgi:hypothetical protein
MPPRTVLSSEQRTRLFSIPTDTATMTRHYLLDAADLAVVRARRRASNRLGFAVQLCALRHPGRVLDPSEVLPEPMLAFVAKQLGVDPALFGDYARRAETRREHLLELQKLVRLRSFGLDDWRACLRVGADTAWATDRGEPIIQAMLAHLRANGVLLPSAAVLERIGLAARARARKRIFETLAAGMSDAERDTLARLLTVDPELRRSRFAWLRDYSESPAPSNIVALLDRLEYARGLGNRRRAHRTHSCRPPRPVDRRGGDHDRSAHRRSRAGAANGDRRHPHGDAARASDLRGRARGARRTRRRRDRGRQAVHRPDPARCSRGSAQSGSPVERDAAEGADH